MSNIDLLIIGDDLALNAVGEPALTATETGCIAQDLRHMIRERGYAIQAVADNNPVTRANLMTIIELQVEEDRRIRPGTANVMYLGNGQFNCSAETETGESVSIEIAGAS